MRITERQLRSLIAQHILHESMRSHTRSDLIRDIIRETLREQDEQDDDEGILTQYARTAAQMGLRGLAAVADTLVSPAHAPESVEQAQADQAAWEKRRTERIRSIADMAADVFMLKHKISSKLAAQLGQEEFIRDIYGHELTDELLAGSMLHDVLMTFSFTPATAVPAMVLDSIAYAAEDNKEAAIITLAMAGITQAASGKTRPEIPSEVPKDAAIVKPGASVPITIDDIASIQKYDDISKLVAKKKGKVSFNYQIICSDGTIRESSGGLRVCWKIPISPATKQAAIDAVKEIGDKIASAGFPGAKGIADSAISRLQSGKIDISTAADSSRMVSASQEAMQLMAPGVGGQNLLQRSHLIVDEAKKRSLAIIQSRRAGNIRKAGDEEIAIQSSIHAETGTYEVPMMPDESAMSRRLADRSRENLQNQGVSTQKTSRGDTDAVIVGLSRYGITLESTYISAWGRKSIIVKAPNGEKIAYYKSSGTGSGTPEGTFVPYRGVSFYIAPEQSFYHVSKTKNKVPFVGDPTEAVERHVFDAVNHPFIREPLDRAVFSENFSKIHDVNDMNTLSIRDFVDDVAAMGTENAYLKSMGVKLSPEGTHPGAVFPWPAPKPVPPELVGKTLTVSDILDNVFVAVKNSSRYPPGRYSIRQLYALDSSILNSPGGLSATLASYSINSLNLSASGGVVKYKLTSSPAQSGPGSPAWISGN